MKNIFYLLILLPLLAISYLFYFHISWSIFIGFFIFTYISLIPGYLILTIINYFPTKGYKNFPFVTGVSLIYLMLGGLFINNMLPIFGINQPLTQTPIQISLIISFLILIVFSYIRDSKKYEIHSLPNINFKNIFYCFYSISLLLFSVFGTILLNNSGSNILILILLASIAFSTIYISLKNDIDEGILVLYIFCTSLSLLLMLSLRSWHISGSDIHDEFKVFQLTKYFGHWSMTNIQHAYNACLSITVLPTILSTITRINDEYIYKFFYQIYFSIVPVCCYLLFRKYLDPKQSFFSVFYLLSQPFFIQPMVSLARQEVAFLFFALFIYSLFARRNNTPQNQFLSLLFGSGIIVSHYSTNYVTILLLCSAFILKIIYQFISKVIPKKVSFLFSMKDELSKNFITLPTILFLVFGSYLWYSQLTNTTDNLAITIKSTIKNLNSITKSEMEDAETSQALTFISSAKTTNKETVSIFKQSILEKFKNTKEEKYLNRSSNAELIYPLGDKATEPIVSIYGRKYIYLFFQLLRNLTKFYALIGALYLSSFLFRKSLIDKEYIMSVTVITSIIVLLLTSTILSSKYNLSRIYLQSLLVISLGVIYGGNLIFFFIKSKPLRTQVIHFSIIFVFLFFHGFISQLFGNSFAYMHLNNYGEDYDKFYTHSSEVFSAIWLKEANKNNTAVFADNFSFERLRSFGDSRSVLRSIVPDIIYKNSYVYARYTNVVLGKVQEPFKSNIMNFNFPYQFLDENKDVIYSNKETIIYK